MEDPAPISTKNLLRRGGRVLMLAGAALGIIILLLAISGLLRWYSVPTSGMHPAISSGENIWAEGISYLTRLPHRGDIVVFKTDDLEGVPPGLVFFKRVAGQPGETLKIADGKLYVDGEPTPLSNEKGPIEYTNIISSRFLKKPTETVLVPEAHYFVLGDNSANSSDSRSFGFVPAKSVKGRVLFHK